MTDLAHATFDSPIGLLTAVADDGALCGLYQEHQRHRPEEASFGREDRRLLGAVETQLAAYFEGTLSVFDLPLAMRGTPFQREVWAALLAIPYGTTCSYGDIASAVGRPGAARAVGLANGRNPVSIVVPCHRVVGSRGDLTGYGGGLERKQWLLSHEEAHCTSASSQR